jgi:tRNA dimethylallyltransferase
VTRDPTKVVVVAGPTASGKTASAIALADALGGEIVGADSIQIYRELDIGSAKPTRAELGGRPHHLIDVLEPTDSADAMRYAQLADAAIASIAARRRLPIVVGGTGLWIRALLRGLVDLPPVDPEIRRRLEEAVRIAGSPAAHDRLRTVDPRTAAVVHPNDALRIVRALEVHAQTGEPLGELRAAHALGVPRYQAVFIVLDVPVPTLKERIAIRVDGMLTAGLIEETRGIVDRHGEDIRPLKSVGYRQVLEHLQRDTALEELRREINAATRVYARRQRTWFKNEPGVDLWTAPVALTSAAGVDHVRTLLSNVA